MNAQQPPPPSAYPQYGAPPARVPDHPQTTVVLVLGIVGVTVFQLCAPIAWYLGTKAKREIEASNGALGGLGMVNLGRILGIVGTVIIALSLVIVLVVVGIIVIAAAGSA